MSGGMTAAAKVAGEPGSEELSLPGEILKGGVTMAPMAFLPAAKSVLGAMGWKAPTDAAILSVSSALYDHFVRGADIDPQAIAKQTGMDVPGFMLMNGLMAVFTKRPWLPTRDGKITSEGAEKVQSPESTAQGQEAKVESTAGAAGAVGAKGEALPNPVSNYEPAAELQARMTAAAQRELAGDSSPEFRSILTSIYADAATHSIYAIEKQRLVAEAARLKTEQEATAAPVPPTPAGTTDPAVPPAGGIPLGRVSVDPTKVQEHMDAGKTRHEAIDLAAIGAPVTLPGTTSTPAPGVPPEPRRVNLDAIRRAAMMGLESMPTGEMDAGPVADYLARARAEVAAKQKAQMDDIRRLAAVSEAGMTIDELKAEANRDVAASPESKSQSPKPPEATETAAKASGVAPEQVVEAAKPDAAVEQAVNPISPLLDRVDFDTGQIVPGQVAKGKKSAAAFYEGTDEKKLFSGTTVEDPKTGKVNNQLSKQVIFLAKGDQVVEALATNRVTEKGRRKVAMPDGQGKVVTREWQEVLDEGWKPLGSAKLKGATRDHAVTYSAEAWRPIADELRARSSERKGGLEPVSDAVSAEMIGGGDAGMQGASVVTTPSPALHEWRKANGKLEPELAGKLLDEIGEPKWDNVDEARDQITDGLSGLPQEQQRAILETISPRDARSGDVDYQAGMDRLTERIYESSKSGGRDRILGEIAGNAQGAGRPEVQSQAGRNPAKTGVAGRAEPGTAGRSADGIQGGSGTEARTDTGSAGEGAAQKLESTGVEARYKLMSRLTKGKVKWDDLPEWAKQDKDFQDIQSLRDERNEASQEFYRALSDEPENTKNDRNLVLTLRGPRRALRL